jgi:hypothetical protein
VILSSTRIAVLSAWSWNRFGRRALDDTGEQHDGVPIAPRRVPVLERNPVLLTADQPANVGRQVRRTRSLDVTSSSF